MTGDRFVQQVAATIRAEATYRGLTQGEFADELGMHKVTMSTKWRGVSAWKLEELPRIALLFGHSSVYSLLRPRDGASGHDMGPDL